VEPRKPGCWFYTSANPTCRELLPAQYTYGNAGRNTLRGDGLMLFDMSLIKTFRVAEGKIVDFRAQVFNLANSASFSNPSGTVNLATGGLVTSTRNQARVFEFGLKFSY
jgi:hypothetical protein